MSDPAESQAPSALVAMPADAGTIGLFNNPNDKVFEVAQRMALALASSTMVPKTYRGEENVGNCMIALDMAWRFGMNPLMVMQNLFVVYGNPSWSGQMCISLINSSGLFRNPLAFEYKGTPGGKPGEVDENWGCRAWAVMKSTGEKVVGPWVDIAMAKAEGWYDRRDKDTGQFVSKWRTIPEIMMTYRAGTYFGRTKCPERLMGMKTVEESEDMGPSIDVETVAMPSLGEETPAAATTPAATTTTTQPAQTTTTAPAATKRTRKKTEPAAPAGASAPPTPPAPPAEPEKPATPPPATKAEPPAEPPKPAAPPPEQAPAAPAAPAAGGDTPQIALARRLHEDIIDVNDFFDYLDASGMATVHHVALDTIEDINGLPAALCTELLAPDSKKYAGLKRTFSKKPK